MSSQLALSDAAPAATRTASSWRRRRPEHGVLHDVVRSELETFLALADASGQCVPRFVERELRAYLECGLLCFGFVRVHCDDCGDDRLVAFSCKGRGFCPSCLGRRMADTAAHLTDRVLPEVRVRQWVVSFPWALRFRLAYDRELCSAVLRLFVRTIFSSLRRRARAHLYRDTSRARCGAVTFVQRFGDALNLNLHFHTLVLDGVYLRDDRAGSVRFHALPSPSDAEIEQLTARLARRLQRLLERRGLFENATPDPALGDDSLLPELADASVRGRIATGPRAGQRVLRLGDRIDPEDLREASGPCCANVGGVSLHANVAVPARDRRRLERLCRYVARPPIATERLSRLPDGRLLYRLKRRWRDGTTHVVFEPLELLEKLAALIPPPRTHLVRYHGVLAPAARERAQIVPEASPPEPVARPRDIPQKLPPPATEPLTPLQCPAQRIDPYAIAQSGDRDRVSIPVPAMQTTPAEDIRTAQPPLHRDRRLSWADLMRRVFRVDVLECPRCHGRMRILTALDQPDVIRRILTHLGLPARAPPILPPRINLLESFKPEPAL